MLYPVSGANTSPKADGQAVVSALTVVPMVWYLEHCINAGQVGFLHCSIKDLL